MKKLFEVFFIMWIVAWLTTGSIALAYKVEDQQGQVCIDSNSDYEDFRILKLWMNEITVLEVKLDNKNRIDISAPSGQTEAAEKFFEFLQKYINDNYYIIPKKCLKIEGD